MKEKILTFSVFITMTASVFAQGQFNFNASSGRVKYTTDGITSINVPAVNGQPTIAGLGNLTIQIWSAPAGTPGAGWHNDGAGFGRFMGARYLQRG